MAYRRRNAKRKPMRRYKKRGVKSTSFGRMAKLGHLKVTRKMQQFSLYNTAATAGGYNINGTWPGAAPIGINAATTASTTGLIGYYDVIGSMSVSLNQLLNYTEFTTLFDKYRIDWIRLRVFSGANTAAINGKGLLPSLVWSTDEDDAVTTGLTVDGIREKMGCKERQFPQDGRPISIFIRPKIASMNAFGGLTTTVSGVSVKKADYINSSFAGLPHYGLKFAIRDLNLDTQANGVYTNIRFDITCGVSLRDVQ